MSAEVNPPKAETPAWRPASFPRPGTYPQKWDLSSFETPNVPAKNDRLPQASPANEADLSTTDGADWKPEPFPEPRTYPSNWDLSELA